MTRAEAKELLLLHAFCHPRSGEDPKSTGGFLGSLRPYAGRLVAENLIEVMEALRTLASDLSGATADREVVAALWAICHLGRSWGVEAGGMLRRNGLISEADVDRLAEWIETISYATLMLLTCAGEEEAFHTYDRERERLIKMS